MIQSAQNFEQLVALKYQLYNGLFLSLPFEGVHRTGILLPLLEEACQVGLENKHTPAQIIKNFFLEHVSLATEKDEIDFLFRIIQYVERQVVLIDALEDAAYTQIRPRKGFNSFTSIAEKALKQENSPGFEQLINNFGLRVVLTAHPTQFYPASVLAVITDITEALKSSDNAGVKELLHQLGKTAFLQKEKPGPYDEASRLVWYLEQILYTAVGQLLDEIGNMQENNELALTELIQIGFWPGGDRDGNAFVTPEITLKVAEKMRTSILDMYRQDLRKLHRRLSFQGVSERVQKLEFAIKQEIEQANTGISSMDFMQEVKSIYQKLIEHHQGLFADKVLSLYRKINAFGYHFASLDIRQDSRKIAATLAEVLNQYRNLAPENLFELSDVEQISELLKINSLIDIDKFTEPLVYDTLASMKLIKEVQQRNGERGIHRYIISNCRGPIDVIRVYTLFRMVGWTDFLLVDIVPLFETINDLAKAGESMMQLYGINAYAQQLKTRNSKQTVMLGFSDGTKDGGYLMANWSIYQAKKAISISSEQVGVKVVFFDGRGGPPARGGGNAYSFYSDLGPSIHSSEIQMTVQGQTISSHYGTVDSGIHNLELLLMAGLRNNIRKTQSYAGLDSEQAELLQQLATSGYVKYKALKESPLFLPYLEHRSTLLYYGKANIGSRPSKRSDSKELALDDLRAIPFVGAWSQLKQNVPGFYGVGTALKEQEYKGNFEACRLLYQQSLFFKALIDNSMQSMSKTNFELTSYMRQDKVFGEFWLGIYDEFVLSKAMVLKLSGKTEFLADNPVSQQSIALREKVVLPLSVIQQYALIRLQELKQSGNSELLEDYEKIIIRSLFGNINASRNSA